MPIALERELKKMAKKKFPKDEKRRDAYVYGTINKIKQKQKGKK